VNFSNFFGIVATLEFALLGLWWVAVQGRPDLRGRRSKTSRAAYLVSLQFVLPGTAALLAQVDPQLTGIWRVAFAIAGLTGVVSVVLLAPSFAASGAGPVLKFMRIGAVPVYAVIVVVALLPSFPPSGWRISALQLEALLFCLLILVSSQIAWAVAMQNTPGGEPGSENPVQSIDRRA
jgi:cytochrome bd-type quinol oxidase subunit 2